MMIAAAGCREDPALPHACACTYLTDTDDEGTTRELVCASSPERAAAIARGCAARGAPAPVKECACAREPGGAPCRTGECLSPAKRD
ncbi:Hypothetical protein A7982_04915 [Minicystis rosea]|nr:Hypothetical protein A7982_04915 [Minicystis rosea]